MIEISHRQARVLIREGIDRTLPDEQWSALQAHLESCAECRAYQRSFAQSERDLRRVLQHRWSAAFGPVGSVWSALTHRRKRREQVKLWLKRGLIGAGILALLILWAAWQRSKSMEVEGIAADIGSSVTPTHALTFRGVIAYPEKRGGRTSTVLLTAGGGAQGLTTMDLIPNSEQSQYAPAWSPDGEWLAFLQNSPTTTKTELYVTHVSGTRLTPLTDSPNIDWSGPLSWSSDGKYIALIGTRSDQGNTSWIYLAALDGSGVKALPGTRDVLGSPRYSPGLPLLSFSDAYGGLHVYDSETGFHGLLRYGTPQRVDPTTAQDINFDWTPGGHAMVYLTKSEGTLFLRLSPDIQPAYNTELTGGTEIEHMMDSTILRSVSWVPNNLLVATLFRIPSDCWVVRLNNPYHLEIMPRNLIGLCIAGSLKPDNFTSDGNWLVAWARTPEEENAGAPPAPYALRIPDDLNNPGSVYFEKLADFSPPAGTVAPLPDLAVRPHSMQSLGLSPRPVSPYQARLPAPKPPADLGELVFNRPQKDGKYILFASQSDASNPYPLTNGSLSAFCPSISPDKSHLSFVTVDYNVVQDFQGPNLLQSVVLADADGKNQRVLFDLRKAPEASSAGVYREFGCPVWSPDGKWIASVLHDGLESSLALAPVDLAAGSNAGQVTFIGVGPVSRLMLPRWTPDGQRILLAYPDLTGGSPARVRLASLDPFRYITSPAVPPDSTAQPDLTPSPNVTAAPIGTPTPLYSTGPPPMEALKTFEGWSDIAGLEYSPDGKEAALILVYNGTTLGDTRSFAQLTIVRTDRWDLTSAPNYDISADGSSTLHWLSDGRVAFVTRAGPGDRYSAYLLLYSPTTLRTENILTFDDVIINMAWSQGDRWVAFTSESGLWVLDTESLLQGKPTSPLLLDNQATWQVEWK